MKKMLKKFRQGSIMIQFSLPIDYKIHYNAHTFNIVQYHKVFPQAMG